MPARATSHRTRLERGHEAAAAAADVVVVHRVAEHDVAVRVEALGELLALVVEVALDRVPPARERVFVALVTPAEALLELELGPVAHRARCRGRSTDPDAVRRPAARRSSRRRGSSGRRGSHAPAARRARSARRSPSHRTRSPPRRRRARGTRPPTRARACRPSIRRRPRPTDGSRAGRRARPRSPTWSRMVTVGKREP